MAFCHLAACCSSPPLWQVHLVPLWCPTSSTSNNQTVRVFHTQPGCLVVAVLAVCLWVFLLNFDYFKSPNYALQWNCCEHKMITGEIWVFWTYPHDSKTETTSFQKLWCTGTDRFGVCVCLILHDYHVWLCLQDSLGSEDQGCIWRIYWDWKEKKGKGLSRCVSTFTHTVALMTTNVITLD